MSELPHGGETENIFGISLMLALIAAGVFFIVHGSMMLARTNIAQYNLKAAEVLESHEIATAKNRAASSPVNQVRTCSTRFSSRSHCASGTGNPSFSLRAQFLGSMRSAAARKHHPHLRSSQFVHEIECHR